MPPHLVGTSSFSDFDPYNIFGPIYIALDHIYSGRHRVNPPHRSSFSLLITNTGLHISLLTPIIYNLIDK